MKAPRITFRLKVTLVLSGVIFLLGIIAVLYARNDMRRILDRELESRGEAIAKDLAANSTDLLLTSDLVGLYDLVNRAKLNNEDVRYVFIISPTGEVKANTFGRGLPQGLLEANAVAAGQETRLRRLNSEEGVIRDIAAPIFGGKAGTVRVGMTGRSVVAAVAQNTRALIVLVAVTVAIGLVVSYWLSYYLTRPLRQLLSAVQSVARGDLSHRIASPGGDEVGHLGNAFNVMARELEAKEAARRNLMEQVIFSQEEERKRVARELHDELAQQLTSVLLSLETVEGNLVNGDRGARQAIRRARQITSGSLAETRKLISDLRPTVLDDLGLVPAIRSYAEGHLRAVDAKALVAATGVPASLPPSVEIAVFRIVQEAINNVAKHAKARQVRIALQGTSGALHVEVTDDGQGFLHDQMKAAVGARGSGLGLRGMEERTRLLGGTLVVSSKVGLGTSVKFSIPISQGPSV